MTRTDRERYISRRTFLTTMGFTIAGAGLVAAGVGNGLPNPDSAEAATDFLTPKTIDGVETYGDGAPLSGPQFDAVIADINQRFESGNIPVAPNIYYGAYIIPRSWYQSFAQENGGKSFQTFLKNVYASMTSMLPSGIRTEARDVFVVADNAFQNYPQPPGSWNVDYYYRGPKPIDGWRGYPWDTKPSVAEFNAEKHEKFHRVFRITDEYWLDSIFTTAGMTQHLLELASQSEGIRRKIEHRLQIQPGTLEQYLHDLSQRAEVQSASDVTNAFRGVRPDWQEYVTSRRKRPPDENGDNIMSRTDAPNLSSFAEALLTDRLERGVTHNFLQTVRDHDGFQVAGFVAGKNVLNLGTQYNRHKITIYGTSGTIERTLTEIQSGTIQNGKFDMGNPFEGRTTTIDGTQMVTGETGVLFIRVEGDPDNPFITWMDVRDLSAAFLKTGKPSQGIEISPKLGRTGALVDHDFSGNTNARALPPLPTSTPTNTPTESPINATPTPNPIETPTAVPQREHDTYLPLQRAQKKGPLTS